MKHMRKLVTLVVVLAMVMAFMVPTAMAAEIKVDNVLKGETYKAYKILEYTSSGSAYSYYLEVANPKTAALKTILETVGFTFTESADGTQYILNETALTADQIVAALKIAGLTEDNVLAYSEVTPTADGQAVFSDIATGYWFITTTTGALCSIQSFDDEALVVEKNSVPSVDKKQSATEGGYADDDLSLNMGDKVYYQIEVTIGKGTNQDIVLTDTATAGIKLDNAISVKKDGVAVAAENYTVTNADEAGFVLTLEADYVSTLNEGDKITITYTATVDIDATVNNTTANSNTIKLEYSKQEATDSVYVATYDFVVKKTDGTNFLDGAEFRLYDALNGGNEIKLATDGTGCYKSTTGEATIDINTADGVNVRGLKPGTYYLEEVVVPDGYNKLAARQEVKITSGGEVIIVVNQAGTVLPSTGGMGTTIFYILGGLMVVGAAVVLVTNKRMRGQM